MGNLPWKSSSTVLLTSKTRSNQSAVLNLKFSLLILWYQWPAQWAFSIKCRRENIWGKPICSVELRTTFRLWLKQTWKGQVIGQACRALTILTCADRVRDREQLFQVKECLLIKFCSRFWVLKIMWYQTLQISQRLKICFGVTFQCSMCLCFIQKKWPWVLRGKLGFRWLQWANWIFHLILPIFSHNNVLVVKTYIWGLKNKGLGKGLGFRVKGSG